MKANQEAHEITAKKAHKKATDLMGMNGMLGADQEEDANGGLGMGGGMGGGMGIAPNGSMTMPVMGGMSSMG